MRITLFRGLHINLISTSKDVVSHIIPTLHIRAAVFFSVHQQRRIDLNSPSAESRRFANGASRCSHLNVENKGDRRNELGLKVPETARRIDPGSSGLKTVVFLLAVPGSYPLDAFLRPFRICIVISSLNF